MSCKKILPVLCFCLLSVPLSADDFTDLLQDLAMQTACIGQYSATESGGGWYNDPHDYYQPSMLATRFARMSGERTRTQTFYGICFDYAQAAWDDVKAYQALYNRAGMKNQEWYIAAVDSSPDTIILYDPVSAEKATRKVNGVYVREKRRVKVYTHDAATQHAWLWVQRTDGTWYWIDPTWTDTTGYVWWGYVDFKSGREIRLPASAKYCVITDPATIPQQPSLPSNAGTSSYVPKESTGTMPFRMPPFPSTFIVGVGFTLPSEDMYHGSVSIDRCGFSASFEDANITTWVGFFSLDYLINKTNADDLKSVLLGCAVGKQIFNNFVLYAGGGIGIKMDFSAEEFDFFSDTYFAWKVNGGIRFQIWRITPRIDISYNSVFKAAACSMVLGFVF